jgi:ATP-dependent metalloprotease FtsH
VYIPWCALQAGMLYKQVLGVKEGNLYMDDKDGSRPSQNNRPRKFVPGNVKNRKKIVKFLKTHRSALTASLLTIAIVILLFGIFSLLPPLSVSDVPAGETAINYSTFLTQVKADNVLAVKIQGNGINALLLKPLNGQAAALSAAQRTTQIAAWTRYNSSSNSTWSSQSSINPALTVYTDMPAAGSTQLLSLLVSKQIVVTTQPVPQTAVWLRMLLEFAPLLFLIVLLAIVLAPQARSRIPQNMNDRMAHFTKKRAWRLDSAGSSSEQKATGEANRASKSQTPGMAGHTSRTAFTPSGAAQGQRAPLPPPTTFADVAGIDEVRVELEEIVQFLRSPEKFTRLGARIPRGAMLVGPPGTGKTLLARAVAGEAGVPFFSISASEFVEMFVGVGASRVRDLFAQARQAAPAVIFIDEIDAVGRKRSVKAMGNDERDQTLNQLLVELDGFNERQAVVVMAATNRVDILDKALLRPGRFDRHITVSLPDRVGREAILRLHTAKTPLSENVALDRLARMTTGMSGADLANLVNEAALCAARRELDCVEDHCFEDALARVQLGALRTLVMSNEERRVIAYHEGGHALVAYYLKGADKVNRVTILPRGQSLGVTHFIPEEDRYNYSREMLMAKIAVGLGGRTAEELTLGRERVTTGAENDFQVVTSMARRMVTHWGMSDQFGVVFAGSDEAGAGLNMSLLDPTKLSSQVRTLALDAHGCLTPDGTPNVGKYTFAMAGSAISSSTSPDMASVIDREVKKILEEGGEMARSILQEHTEQLNRLADALLEYEQLNRAEFDTLLQA